MKFKLPSARSVAFEIFFAAVTIYSARPAFASLHLPLQDVPQHMAALSILRRMPFDAALREYYELTLSRTQYLFVYALGVPLSIPFGVEYATRLLVAATVISTPYAMRFALRRTGGDERFATLVWPFAWNPQMMLGFLNFLLGVPIALTGIGIFANAEHRKTRRSQIVLALLALAAFYSHLIAYGLLGLGVLLLHDWGGTFQSLRDAIRRPGADESRSRFRRISEGLRSELLTFAFLAPSFIAVCVWILRSPARDRSIRAGGVGREIILTWPDRMALPAQFRETVLNTQGASDEVAMIAWGLCLLAVLALLRADPSEENPEPRVSSRIGWLPCACAALYVTTPESYGWIWPIHTRFAVAAVLLLPLAFGRSRSMIWAWFVPIAMAWVTVEISRDLTVNFQHWDAEELGDLDAALAHARPGRRLIALVPPLRSGYVPSNVPLLHAAAYYVVRGGHVATFSFTDFPQSPFRYRDVGPRPRKLQPRWEWETSLRTADPEMTYYDYVLARIGYADEAARLPQRYTRLYAGSEWNLYERHR